MIRLEMKNYNMNYNNKNITLSLGKIDKYEYLTDKSSDRGRIIEQAKFTYSHSGKSLEKHWRARRKIN